MSLENSSRASRPSQNSGAEISTSALPIEARSQKLRRLSAETMPTDSPATIQTTAAPSVSEIVAGRRSPIRLITDCWL